MGIHHGYRPSGNAGNIFLDYLYSNFKPKLVYDFSENVYILNYRGQSFTDSVTHAATSPRTMYDSTGTLVWAPHNLLDYSQTFDTGWTISNMTVSANSVVAPDGTTTAATLTGTENTLTRVFNEGTAGQSGSNVTTGLFVKAGTAPYMTLRLYDGAAGHTVSFDTSDWSTAASSGASNIVSTALADGWQYIAFDVASPGSRTVFEVSVQDTAGYSGDGSAGTLYVWGAHVFRSDLGGMVDNPDQPAGLEKYVPTTSAAVYLPRRNAYYHDGENWVNGGLYHESAASTNLLTNSNTLSNWTATNSSVTQDETGPDDATSAWTLVDDSGGSSGVVSLQRDVTVSTYTTYTFSVYAKADQLSVLALGVTDFSFPNDGEIYFDLNDGTVLSAGGAITGRIEKAKNDFYRCSITFTTDTSDTQGTLKMYVVETVGSTDATPIDGTSSIILYGTQFEATEVATSYIPTGSSQATRTAETLTIPAAKIPYSTSNNTVRMQGAFTYDDFDQSPEYTLFRHRADASNNITLELNTDSSTTGYLEATQSTTNESFSVATYDEYVPDINREYRAAVVYSSSRMSIATDGVLAFGTNNPSELPDLSATDLDLGYDYTGFVKNIVWWDADITDVGLSTVSETDLTPLLYADFVNDYYRDSGGEASFDDIFEHSATGLMTMFDSDGILKWAPHNFVPYSNDFSNAVWVSNETSVESNTIIAPDGTSTADKLVESAATSKHSLRGAVGGLPDNISAIFALCVKDAGDGRYIVIGNGNRSGNEAYATFNPANGVLENSGGGDFVSAGSIPLNDGWYLCFIKLKPVVDANDFALITLSDIALADETRSYTGDGVSGVYIWGAHCYRSDDLAMADNPDQTVTGLEKYVPTTTAAVYLPRRNTHYYNGTAWVNAGLQLESEARTNLIIESNDFNTNWNFNSNITSVTSVSGVTAPDGTENVTKLEDSGSNGSYVVRDLTITGDATLSWCFSVFVKYSDHADVRITLKGDGAGNASADVDLSLSASGVTINTTSKGNATADVVANLEEVSNGWYRVSVATTALSTSNNCDPSGQITLLDSGGATGYSGVGTGVYIYGAQIEEGSTPSSYIPTNGSAATRAAETLEVSSALVPSSPTVRMAGKINYTDEGTASQQTFWRRYKDADEFIIVDLDTDSTDTGEVNVNQSNGAATATVAVDAYESNVDPIIPFDIVSSHGASRTNISASGLLGTADTTSNTLPSFTTENLDVGYDFMGNIEKFAVWDTALADGKIANITQGSEPFIVGTPSVE